MANRWAPAPTFIGSKNGHPIFKDSWVGQDYEKYNPCKHADCKECRGTGIKEDRTACIHMTSCPCPRCNPYHS